jgi:FecR protein
MARRTRVKTYPDCTLFLARGVCLFLLGAGPVAGAADSSKNQARVTRIIRDVRLLPAKAPARPAALDDKVSGGTGVRTGDESRSELTFVDQTITRVGANTLFTFNNAGRSVDLSSGSVLFSVPKNSGGGQMRTGAVTVGITGTSVILDSTRAGRNRLIALEGGARVSLNKFPKESAMVRGGQMLDVPAGATKLPPVVNVDLDKIMKTHPLITDFRPLPSRDLIYAAQRNLPGNDGPGPGFPPIIGNLFGAGPGVSVGTRHTTVPSGNGSRHGHPEGEGSSVRGERGGKKPGMKGTGSSETAHPAGTPLRKKPSRATHGSKPY